VPSQPQVPNLSSELLADPAISDYLSEKYKARLDTFWDELVKKYPGWYALAAEIFMQSRERNYRLQLKMPGRTLFSNGFMNSDASVHWDFQAKDFPLQAMRLEHISATLDEKALKKAFPGFRSDGLSLGKLAMALRPASPQTIDMLRESLRGAKTAPLIESLCSDQKSHGDLLKAFAALIGQDLTCPNPILK